LGSWCTPLSLTDAFAPCLIFGLKDCIYIQTNLLDQAVSQRVLEVLQPEQFQIALRAINQLQERSEAIDRQWRMRSERLDYQAQLAQRRYEQVDPSHRLVAATLEQHWNQALEEAQRLRDDYQNYRQQQGLELTGKQQAELLAMAEDLPRLWQAQTTSAKDRKRMLRLLIVRIVSAVIPDLNLQRWG
jgi:hypothetical protein